MQEKSKNMQPGTLILENNNWKINYRKGKSSKIRTIDVRITSGLNKNYSNKPVEFDFTDNGQLKTIICEGQTFPQQVEKNTATALPITESTPPDGYIRAKVVKKQKGIELWVENRDRPFWLPNRLIKEETYQILADSEMVFLKTDPQNTNFVISVLFDNEEIINKDLQQRDQQNRGRTSQNNQPQKRIPAHAPYNYVPINDQIVDAKKYSSKSIIPPFDSFAEEHHSGYINLNIEAKTKVFIGSGSSDTGNYKFFAPDGTPRIPGSSLRGMVRTMVEICSWGQFKFFENKQLFYRTFENSSMGRDFYRKRMVGSHGQPKVRAGYLTKDGRKYKIIPALCNSALCNTEFYRVEKTVAETLFSSLRPFVEKKVFFKPKAVINQSSRHNRQLDYALLDSLSDIYDKTDYPTEGKLIASGNMPGEHGKHLHWVINRPDKSNSSNYKNVSKDVIDTYWNDASRKIQKFDLISRLESQKEVPCFYLEEDIVINQEENGKPIKKKETVTTAIGHTPFFRLPYQNKIGDLLPDVHKEFKGIDIPTAIFGNESTGNEDSGFAGRVFFEDAVCNSDCNNRNATTHCGQSTAISPKPTSFQLYLGQKSIDVKKEELKHYDSQGAELRGNKLYWHKNPDRSNTEKLQFNNARIRFTNLNDVELGALLFALDLPEGCCHKIGMGKPLGLGSIRITPTLFIDEPQKKYASFSAAMKYESLKKDKKEIDDFIVEFENHIKRELKLGSALSSLWNHGRMKQLKVLLNWENPPKNTDYMPFKVNGKFNFKFKNRNILPDATDVK